jgi:arylsulfatase A-like enzyme
LAHRTKNSKCRSIALAFLFAAFPAIGIGIFETIFTLREFTPSLLELAYGANIHLLFAFAAILLTRVIFWKLSNRAFLPVALAMFCLVELSFTASFWILKTPLAPRLDSMSGKIFAAATITVSLLVGITLIWLAGKYLRSRLWEAWMSSRAAGVGAVMLILFVAINSSFIIRHYVFDKRHAESTKQFIDSAISPADVIIILVDTLRRDHLSFFGYGRSTSANIDRIAQDSYVFDTAYTPSNKTVPSIASIFTGLYPSSHQVTGPFQRLPQHLRTMAEQYRNHGYATAAFVANRLVSVQNGYDRGFEAFFPAGVPWWCYHGRTGLEALMNRIYIPLNAESGNRLNQELFEWLDKNGDAPRFVYIHYMEPHSNYAPPQDDYAAVAGGIPRGCENPPMFHQYSKSTSCIDWECLEEPAVVPPDDLQEMIAGYDGEIHTADRFIGDVFAELRKRQLFDAAHIVFLTDHGEEFGDHAGWFHGHSIYEELTRSPLIYRPPGGVDGSRRINRPISLVDFFANLYSLTGVESTPMNQGLNIAELGGESTAEQRMPVVSSLPPHLYSLRLGQWKLIRRGDITNPTELLFDLHADPAEQIDLAQALPDTLDLLVDYLDAIVASREAVYSGEDLTHRDPEMLKKLRSLGYIE